jgi:ABC-type phosphate transport system substrate-binding protein
MRAITTFVLLLAVLLGAPVARLSADVRAPAYQVIVHPANPATSVEREFLADAFLKKVATWPSGESLHPVDLAPSSPVRRAFSEEVLHRSVADVKGYWQQRIFAGRDVPPPELDADDDVIKYVLKYEGAVGYVSGTARVSGPKVVAVR